MTAAMKSAANDRLSHFEPSIIRGTRAHAFVWGLMWIILTARPEVLAAEVAGSKLPNPKSAAEARRSIAATFADARVL